MDRVIELRRKVKKYIENNDMINEGDTVVAGISGGADSMCLLDMLLFYKKECDFILKVIHVHHGIRGVEADEDMRFVEEYCRKNKVAFECARYDIPKIAKEERLSSEEAGRIKRYEAFNRAIEESGCSLSHGRIAVAHNQNDNSETFLLNLFRGTGLKGLTGISPLREKIIRPVLCLTREEIVEYLCANNIEYRNDSTNNEDEYTRNKVRLNILPYVRENINDKVMENINRTAGMLTEVHEYMNKQAEKVANKYVTYMDCGNKCKISHELWTEDKIIVCMSLRIAVEKVAGKLKDITSLHIDSVYELGMKQVSKNVNLPYEVCAVRTYQGVELQKKRMSDGHRAKTDISFKLCDLVGKAPLKIEGYGEIRVSAEKLTKLDLSENIYTKWMNCGILEGDLTLRNRASGDYMVISRNGSKKKLKDLLIDMKIPKEKRDDLLLLAKGSEVLWIIGERMSERCKVNIREENTEIIRIEYIRNGEL